MKFFDKLVNLYSDHNEFFACCLFFLFISSLVLSISYSFLIEANTEKNIITNTKDYSIYEHCKKIDFKFYCWNEVE